jgi:hypothetical protein
LVAFLAGIDASVIRMPCDPVDATVRISGLKAVTQAAGGYAHNSGKYEEHHGRVD